MDLEERKIVIDKLSFVREKGTNYFYNSWKRKYLHQYLWEKENGKIPKGYQIHHTDHNPLNNSIDNLEIIKIGTHQKYHGAKLTNEQRERLRNNFKMNAQPAAIQWHKSEKGSQWHREHYERTKHLLHAKSNFKCNMCGKTFIAANNNVSRFCSNPCKSKWRRNSGIDDVNKNCKWCNGEFTTNKYSKALFCSRSCKNKNMHFERKLKDSPILQE